jgi:hypothetical protein
MQSAAQASDPTQQKRAENKRDAAVDSALQCLDQAARGQHVAWSLSNALESVGRHFRGTSAGPISKAQCDELLSAVVRAQLGAITHLPESYSREQIDAGMQALAGQVMLWAETPERSAQRRRHALADLGAYARMFRNDMHNVSLREEIDRRAWERREEHIQPLRNKG